MFEVFGFYKFKKFNSLKKYKDLLQDFLIKTNIRGTIIIANEGINATISGKANDIKLTIAQIKKILDFKKFDSKNISKTKLRIVFLCNYLIVPIYAVYVVVVVVFLLLFFFLIHITKMHLFFSTSYNIHIHDNFI